MSEHVVIERTIEAPVATVWRMWTEPEEFAAWYGPVGASVRVAELDVVVGGRRRVSMVMTTPDGTMEMWFAGEFTAVDEPHRLAYTEVMTDADGNPTMGDPTEVIVELAADGDRTHLVLTHKGVPADSPGAMGWTMALDTLAAHLA